VPTSDTPPDDGAGRVPLSAAAAAGIRRLRALIDDVRRRTRGWIWVEAVALVALALAAAFWGTMAFDWAVEPPVWVRVAMVAAALVGVGLLLRRKLFGRLATPLGDAALATLVERGHPGFRDSLSTAVELTSADAEGIDVRLLERTIAEAAAEADRVDARTLFRRRRLLALASAGGIAVATILGLVVSNPAVAGTWARRMLLLDETPWPRRVHLVAEGFVDGIRKVARGSDVDVVVVADASREIPEVVELRTRPARGGAWRTERMGVRGGVEGSRQAFGHVVKGVTEDLEVEIRGGDARLRGLRLVAVDAPSLERLECTATLPEYLGGGERTVAASRVLQVPRGSTVDLVLHSTKPLAAASVTRPAPGAGGRPADARSTESRSAESQAADARSGGTEIASLGPADGPAPRSIGARIGPVEGEQTVVVTFTDTDGLTNREPISVVVIAVPDEPPQVSVRMLGISTAVTPTARIPLVGSIADDHGLASAAVAVAPKEGAATLLPVDRVRAGTAAVTFADDAPEVVSLEPFALAPGAAITVRLAARDGCGLASGPNEGTSDEWSLDVVTPEALMAMLEAREILLRRRFESVVSDLSLARERLLVAAAAPPGGSGGDDRGDDRGDEGADAGDDAGTDAGTDASFEGARLGDAASRAAGETGEIADAFRGIRTELDNNRMLSAELENRLVAQIADPLRAVATSDLPALTAAARASVAADRDALLGRVDAVLAKMRAVLDKMMELESFNEVIEILRDVIRSQEEIRSETLRRQRQRAKEVLERP